MLMKLLKSVKYLVIPPLTNRICMFIHFRSYSPQVVSFFAGSSVCRYKIIVTAAANKGWKLVHDHYSLAEKRGCNIYWIDTPCINDYFQTLQPWQCINHFPGMTNITRKARMCQNLELMRKRFPKEYSFYPKTYCLPRDLHLFRKTFGPDGKADQVYIIKPDGGAQGKGIFLTRNVNDIPSNTLCVAQNYILNPLLIDGKKFDLRIYVLVTSCKPLRVYLFKDGLVRICAEAFARPNTANLEERCMHLTNYAVNKFNENFVGDDHLSGEDDTIGSGGNKRSILWLFEWLRKERGEAIVESLWGKIGHICRSTVLSIAPLLKREYDNLFGGVDKLYEASKTTTANFELDKKSFTSLHFVSGLERERDLSQPRGAVGGSRCFEVLGFDIMLDTNCTPILIETNHLPACK
jgi:tubulin polyglutamylase TTLL6/13